MIVQAVGSVVLSLAGLGVARQGEGATRPLDVADMAAPAFSVYKADDGLSDEIWSSVGFDQDGFVWAGSASTLARFDGYRWTPRPLPQARSLVRDLLSDDDGVLWAIFEREGLARYDGNAWMLVDPPRFFHRFSAVHRPDGSSDYWVAHDDGLLQLVDGVWQPYSDTGDQTLARPIRIEETDSLFGEPRQWLATATDGLWYRARVAGTSLPWQRFDHPDLNAMNCTDLVRTYDRGAEELWVLSYSGGVARLRGDEIKIWRSETEGLPSEAIYSAVATYSSEGERTLWIASRGGLVRIRGDEVTTFDRRHGLPSDAVRGVKLQSVDGTDVLWLATEGGIARAALTESRWRTVSLHGARENGIFGLMIEPDGAGGERLWAGSAQDGLALLQDDHWRTFSSADKHLPSNNVRTILRLPGPDGQVWRLVGLLGGHLMRIEDDLSFRELETPWPLDAEDAVTSGLARVHEGSHELWLGTLISATWRLHEGRWTQHAPAQVEGAWIVAGLCEQVTGGRSILWSASNHGLARFDEAGWTLLPSSLSFDDGVRSATLIPDAGREVLWLATSHNGVARIDVTDPYEPFRLDDNEIPAPPDPTVYSVLADSRGRIYVCTNNGVQKLSRKADGAWQEQVFRRADGLVHDECNSNSQLIDAHDRCWVGTLGGLSVHDPKTRAGAGSHSAKALHVTGLRVDGAVVGLPEEEALTLDPGVRDLRFDFTLLAGLHEERSRYRNRLVGQDADDGQWTTDRSRSFSGLPPGDYRFEIEGQDHVGAVSGPISIDFQLRPHWWQRFGVRVAGLLASVLIAVAGARLYSGALRARQRLLEDEVALRTTELNDANLRLTQLSYIDSLTRVANRRRLMEALATALQRARERSLPIGVIVLDVDHFKLYNDCNGHLAGDAALTAIAQALEGVVRAKDLVARFGGEEFACLMVDAGESTVLRIAERMRAAVESLPPRMLGNDTQTLTISGGAQSCVPTAADTPESLLATADEALYRAKDAGRNRICTRSG